MGKSKGAEFFGDILRGTAIGVAFIIPGFSGGSVAAILGVYEKIVGAIADLFSHFKRSLFILLPYALGGILGAAAFLLPVQWGLSHYPIPTVSLFVGLSIGGLPSVTEKVGGRPRWFNIPALLIPCALAAGLSALPVADRPAGFLFDLDLFGYVLLFLVGMIASSALVVPGISGSMLLLIFGYYTPLVETLTGHLLMGLDVGESLLILSVAGAGMAAGFFLVSVLMRFFLKKFPRGTYFAILGFLLGSVFAVYSATMRGAPPALEALYRDPWYWVASAALLLAGNAVSLGILKLAAKHAPDRSPAPPTGAPSRGGR